MTLCASVVVFPLDVNPRPAEQVLRKGQRRGTAGRSTYSCQKLASARVGRVQLGKGLMQHFRDERPAPLSEVSFFHGVLLLKVLMNSASSRSISAMTLMTLPGITSVSLPA